MTIKTVVFSGGGLRGFAYIGAIKALVNYGILLNKDADAPGGLVCNTFAGSSVGGFTALLCALHYTPNELIDFIKYFDYDKLKNLEILNFTESFGLETGNKIVDFISETVYYKTGKKDMTFEELYHFNKADLMVTGTSLKDSKTVYFDRHLTPNFSIVKAVRITISIPLIFTPVIQGWLNGNPVNRRETSVSPTAQRGNNGDEIDNYYEDMYVDGAMLNDLPIEKYDKQSTLGILLKDTSLCESKNINDHYPNLINYIKGLWKCVSKNIKSNHPNYNIVTINTPAICNTFNLDYDTQQRKELLKLGYRSTALRLKELGYVKISSKTNLFDQFVSKSSVSDTDTLSHQSGGQT